MVPESSCFVTVEIVTRVFLSGQLFCLCELEYIINLGGGARGLLSHRTVDSGGPFVYQLGYVSGTRFIEYQQVLHYVIWQHAS
jgi:hypothetical protein